MFGDKLDDVRNKLSCLGLAHEIIEDEQYDANELKEMALATTKAFDAIIRKTVIVDGVVLVDWQQKSDIVGKIKIELEDELIDNIKRKYELDFSFDEMDVIIDGCVDVAKIWIK